MFVVAFTPVRVYNSIEKKPEAVPKHKSSSQRHWRQCAANPQIRLNCYDDENAQQLQSQVYKYRNANEKLKRLTTLNLRATKSALKDVEDVLEILQDIYGDSAFEDPLLK